MEGLQIFKIYLNFFGFISIDLDNNFDKNNLNNENLKKDHFRFCEFHGEIDKETNQNYLQSFDRLFFAFFPQNGRASWNSIWVKL